MQDESKDGDGVEAMARVWVAYESSSLSASLSSVESEAAIADGRSMMSWNFADPNMSRMLTDTGALLQRSTGARETEEDFVNIRTSGLGKSWMEVLMVSRLRSFRVD